MPSDLEEGFLMGLDLIRLWEQSKDFQVGAPLLPSSQFCADFSGRQPQAEIHRKANSGKCPTLATLTQCKSTTHKMNFYTWKLIIIEANVLFHPPIHSFNKYWASLIRHKGDTGGQNEVIILPESTSPFIWMLVSLLPLGNTQPTAKISLQNCQSNPFFFN